MDTIYKIKGKNYTLKGIMEKYELETEKEAIEVLEVLLKQGKASIVEPSDFISEAKRDNAIASKVSEIENEENEALIAKRSAKNEEEEKLKISLEFSSRDDLRIFSKYLEAHHIDDFEEVKKRGMLYLRINDITPQEYTKIKTQYNGMRISKTAVEGTKKVVESATNAIDFTAKNVIAPTAKIAGSAVANMGGSLVHALFKTGASLVTATTKAVKETKEELGSDTELLKAQRDLYEAKNTLKRGLNRKNKTGKGITIED